MPRFKLPCLILGLLLTAGCERGDHPSNIGKPAPQFAISDGVQSVDLSKLRGRTVVLNLWATWCAPCIEELPSLLAMQRENPDIAVVAISLDQDDALYRSFLTRNHVDPRYYPRRERPHQQSLRHRPDPRDLRHRPQRHPPPQVRLRPELDQPGDRKLPQETVVLIDCGTPLLR